MLYWMPGPHLGVRLYKESFQDSEIVSKWSNVPLGYSCFEKELVKLPRDFATMLHPVKFYRRHATGGHFAAYERWVYVAYPTYVDADLRTTGRRS
jgi:hypothetical protein